MEQIIDMNLYKKSLTEVSEILKHLNPDEFAKIPENVLQTIHENKDVNYSWEYDISKKLEDQNMEKYTLAILAYLNMEYLLSKEQREIMAQFYSLNDKTEAPEQMPNIAISPIFENKETENNTNVSTELIVVEKNIIKRIFSKIKNFFKGSK